MKKILFSLFLFSLFSFSTIQAQRVAIVDVNAILQSLPDYQSAQKILDNTASSWRQEISVEYDRIKGMYNKYQAEQVLMSDEMRKQKEDEIMEAETKVRSLQKEKFGPEGALFMKRKDLVHPIQEKVYRAIEKFAKDKGFDFMFDKSSASGIIFANPSFDKTEEVKSSLGL